MLKVFMGFMYVYMIGLWILGGLIHLWTVYISYSMAGVFGGIVAFFFPVISEIYIGYNAWNYGGFTNPYAQWLIVLLVMWLFRFVLISILASFENKIEKQL